MASKYLDRAKNQVFCPVVAKNQSKLLQDTEKVLTFALVKTNVHGEISSAG